MVYNLGINGTWIVHSFLRLNRFVQSCQIPIPDGSSLLLNVTEFPEAGVRASRAQQSSSDPRSETRPPLTQARQSQDCDLAVSTSTS